MGVTKFKKGLSQKEIDGLSPKMKRFIGVLEDRFGKDGFVITSGADAKRKNTKSKHRPENGGDAIDIRVNQKVLDYLTRTEDGVALLNDFGYGFINETAALNSDYTAPHYHIGSGEKARNELAKTVKRMASGEIPWLDADNILKQTSESYRRDAAKNYQERLAEIDKPENAYTESEKRQMKQDLQDEFRKSGQDKWVNEQYREDKYKKAQEIEALRKDFEEGTSEAGALYKAVTDGGFEVLENGGIRVTINDDNYENILPYLSEKEKKKFKRKGAYAGFMRGAQGWQMTDKDPSAAYKFLSRIERPYQDVMGQPLFFDLVSDPGGGTISINGQIEPATKLNINKAEADFSTPAMELVPDPVYIETETDTSSATTTNSTSTTGDESSNSGVATEQENATVDKNLVKADATVQDIFGNFRRQELDVPDTLEYNPDDFQAELPIGAVAQAGLAFMGLGDADTDIPRRNERVSEAIRMYGRELQKLSQIGLRPEEEAAMKQQIAQVYQEGMDRLTRSSGGNRNLVLGNMTGLQANRQKGLLAMSLADIQRKDDMLQQSGEVMKYIDEVDRTRDIANRTLDQQEAQRLRAGGEQLASSAMGSLLNELQYARENGPGSANHAYKSALQYEAFGWVPGMEDRGQVGSASYLRGLREQGEALNAEIKAENQAMDQIRNEYYQLDPKIRRQMEADGRTRQWFGERFQQAGLKRFQGFDTRAPEQTSVQTFAEQPFVPGITNPNVNASFGINQQGISTPSRQVIAPGSLYDGDTFYVDDQGQRLQGFDAEEEGYGASRPITNAINQYPISYDRQSNSSSYGRPVRNNVRVHMNDGVPKGHAMDSLYMSMGGRGRWDLNYAQNAQDSLRYNRLNTQFADQLMTEEELRRQKQTRYPRQ